MDAIRLATQSEIDSIASTANLNAQSTVVAFDRQGATPDLAVIKQVTELDPLYPAESTDGRRKALFIWALENTMRIMGMPAYYFQMPVDDLDWQKTVEHWGAERVSKSPEFRYIRHLGTKNAHTESD